MRFEKRIIYLNQTKDGVILSWVNYPYFTIAIMCVCYFYTYSDGVKKTKKKNKEMIQFINKKNISPTDIWGKKFN